MPTPSGSASSILRELVALPSVNPAGRAGTPSTGEAAIAGWVGDHLRKLGAAVEFHLLAPGRPSVVAVFEPANAVVTRTVAFAPHLDTVGTEGMTVPAFQLTRKGSRLYGRGSCDTKGPMAALLAAIGFCVRQRRFRRQSVRWIVAATAGEEEGGAGAEALLKNGFKADFAIALEPTDLRVVHAAKGILRVWITTAGRAAHGATPDRGDNAIYKLLPLVDAIRTELAPKLSRSKDPLLGGATVNVGLISGGTELNVVPDESRVGLDIRTHTRCPSQPVLEMLHELIRRHAPGARLTIHRDAPAFSTVRTTRDMAALRAVARGWAVAHWFCDANLFASHGIPAVAFGPGSIKQAHTHNEFIDARELEDGVAAYRRFLLSMSGL